MVIIPKTRMNDDTGVDYIKPWPIGAPAEGGGVGTVISSNHPNWSVWYLRAFIPPLLLFLRRLLFFFFFFFFFFFVICFV